MADLHYLWYLAGAEYHYSESELSGFYGIYRGDGFIHSGNHGGGSDPYYYGFGGGECFPYGDGMYYSY